MPKHPRGRGRIGGAAVVVILFLISVGAMQAAGQTSVTTYHYDTNRTGWNRTESVLTPANVTSILPPALRWSSYAFAASTSDAALKCR